MKKLLFLATLLFVFSCKKTETPTEPNKVLSGNFWKLDRFADTEGKTLSQNQLNSQAQALFALDYEFRDDNVTRAKDRITKQILNAGTWYLIQDNQVLDIDILGFKGQFKIIVLSKDKMVLQAENNKMISAGQFVNMEFVPAF
ncbi:hypothetical protein Emtol_2809 [Emticicia oligotrophica DSM 17448]|uniref:Lipocalin-like domain-containing protein n=1 Tax=Emticicia oligotrophica (strain DSM 17448 / CIP 109782 / MTCC 6937 / GPTSA100-15) TaxID=929562 RepID=A0ABM5N3B3_EMTOG|nr:MULTISPECIES: hypothetical protein [Emticicia]AFK03944.1 hypothetical protein Emtol_2809 [Emticicia oligotrophica DSM 17448]